jgi:ABC-type dipeptide/oligopeptide/nickel transport system permease subunit
VKRRFHWRKQSADILRYILPNAFAPPLVQATLGVGNAIMSAATAEPF